MNESKYTIHLGNTAISASLTGSFIGIQSKLLKPPGIVANIIPPATSVFGFTQESVGDSGLHHWRTIIKLINYSNKDFVIEEIIAEKILKLGFINKIVFKEIQGMTYMKQVSVQEEVDSSDIIEKLDTNKEGNLIFFPILVKKGTINFIGVDFSLEPDNMPYVTSELIGKAFNFRITIKFNGWYRSLVIS